MGKRLWRPIWRLMLPRLMLHRVAKRRGCCVLLARDVARPVDHRILAEQSGVSGDSLRKRQYGRSQFRDFAQTAHQLSQIPLYIDDTCPEYRCRFLVPAA